MCLGTPTRRGRFINGVPVPLVSGLRGRSRSAWWMKFTTSCLLCVADCRSKEMAPVVVVMQRDGSPEADGERAGSSTGNSRWLALC
jgi:hypothetical protein